MIKHACTPTSPIDDYSQQYLALPIPSSKYYRNTPGFCSYCNCQPLKNYYVKISRIYVYLVTLIVITSVTETKE